MPTSRTEQFSQLVARDPANEKFRFSLAQALLADARPADAVEQLEFCVNKVPDWMVPRILLGKTLLQLGQRAEARLHLERALQLAREQQHEDPERELTELLRDLR